MKIRRSQRGDCSVVVRVEGGVGVGGVGLGDGGGIGVGWFGREAFSSNEGYTVNLGRYRLEFLGYL